jgi:hypothetical protein
MRKFKIMKGSKSLCLSLLLYSGTVFSQENVAVPSIRFSGFIKNDVFFDTRQTVSAREGHFLLFPSPKLLDGSGKDINAKSGYNILAIQSNLSAGLTAPDVLQAKVTGLIEGDFFGISNSDVNMFRLRHAYIKLKWSKTEVLVGQYWHPLFVTSCYPATLSFNTGAPIQPFSRAPQIRITHLVGKLKLTAAFLSQRDYASVGPDGVSSKYLRDSGIPELQIGAEWSAKQRDELILGGGFGYKRLTPQIKTCNNYKTSVTVKGISANGYIKYVSPSLTVKLESIYLENGSEFLSITGFAVKDTTDVTKGILDYTPVRTWSLWNDIHTNGKKIQVGIFSGYTRNMGTKDEVTGPFYLMSNAMIKSLYRISPRLIVYSGNLNFGAEIEYTSALFGEPDNHGIMINTSRVENARFLLSVVYKF